MTWQKREDSSYKRRTRHGLYDVTWTKVTNESNLAQAVIEQAVHDWRRASRLIWKIGMTQCQDLWEKKRQEAESTIIECEQFFLGEVFYGLTRVDGMWFLNKLKKVEKDRQAQYLASRPKSRRSPTFA